MSPPIPRWRWSPSVLYPPLLYHLSLFLVCFVELLLLNLTDLENKSLQLAKVTFYLVYRDCVFDISATSTAEVRNSQVWFRNVSEFIIRWPRYWRRLWVASSLLVLVSCWVCCFDGPMKFVMTLTTWECYENLSHKQWLRLYVRHFLLFCFNYAPVEWMIHRPFELKTFFLKSFCYAFWLKGRMMPTFFILFKTCEFFWLHQRRRFCFCDSWLVLVWFRFLKVVIFEAFVWKMNNSISKGHVWLYKVLNIKQCGLVIVGFRVAYCANLFIIGLWLTGQMSE